MTTSQLWERWQNTPVSARTLTSINGDFFLLHHTIKLQELQIKWKHSKRAYQFYQIKHILNKVAINFFVWFSLFGQSFMESLKSCSLNFVYITNVTGIFRIIYVV